MMYQFRELFGWDMLLVISICGYLWFVEMTFPLHADSDALQFVTIYAFVVGLVVLALLVTEIRSRIGVLGFIGLAGFQGIWFALVWFVGWSGLTLGWIPGYIVFRFCVEWRLAVRRSDFDFD